MFSDFVRPFYKYGQGVTHVGMKYVPRLLPLATFGIPAYVALVWMVKAAAPEDITWRMATLGIYGGPNYVAPEEEQ